MVRPPGTNRMTRFVWFFRCLRHGISDILKTTQQRCSSCDFTHGVFQFRRMPKQRAKFVGPGMCRVHDFKPPVSVQPQNKPRIRINTHFRQSQTQ